MQAEEILELIRSRRSRRRFEERPVEPELLERILEAGRWAPSGRNNQPWRFVVVQDRELKKRIASFTKYGMVIEAAPVIIPVFIHRPSMYSEVKDYQSVGACLQNMLLMAHAQGLGAVWLGEILKNGAAVRDTLELGEDLELMAVIALGWPRDEGRSRRLEMEQLLLARR